MNKHVLALSTALSILAFTPAFAEEATTTTTVDCTQQANANDPACANQQQNNNATTTQDQSGAATTTTTTTDQNNAQSGTTGANGTDAGTGSTTTQSTTTTTTGQSSDATTTTAAPAGSTVLIVPAEQLNGAKMMSANDYIGKTVYDQAGNNIGDVNDLIISNDGQVQAVILVVGGFLGIGEKDVAVKMVQDGDNTRLVVESTKEALKAAPTYDKANRRYATDTSTTTTSTDQTGTTTAAPPTGTVDCTNAANANDPACVNKQSQ